MLEIQTNGWELRQREAKSGKEAICDQVGRERELPVFNSVEQFPLILFLISFLPISSRVTLPINSLLQENG